MSIYLQIYLIGIPIAYIVQKCLGDIGGEFKWKEVQIRFWFSIFWPIIACVFPFFIIDTVFREWNDYRFVQNIKARLKNWNPPKWL